MSCLRSARPLAPSTAADTPAIGTGSEGDVLRLGGLLWLRAAAGGEDH